MKKQKFIKLFVGVCVASITLFSFVLTASAIDLKFANFAPAPTHISQWIMEPWGKMLEHITQGKIKVRFHHGGSLGGPKEAYDFCAKGVTDLSFINISFMPGRFPKTEVFSLPFLGNPYSALSNGLAAWRMYPDYFADEFQDVKIICLFLSPPLQLFSTKKQVKTIEDIKGMKLFIHPAMASSIAALGGSPVSLPPTEVYEALERGTIDGCFLDNPMIKGLRAYEMIKYSTDLGLYSVPCLIIMNLKKYNSLPDDLKASVDAISGTYAVIHSELQNDARVLIDGKFLDKNGVQFYKLPDKEREKAISLVQPLYDKWVKNMEAKGLPGKNLLEDARNWIKYYEPAKFWY